MKHYIFKIKTGPLAILQLIYKLAPRTMEQIMLH
jgi:hypothetical protein